MQRNLLALQAHVCESSVTAEWVAVGSVSGRFATNNLCWASGWVVERGEKYLLTIRIKLTEDDPWLDHLIHADVYGFESPPFCRERSCSPTCVVAP